MRISQSQSIREVFKSIPTRKLETDKPFQIKHEKPLITKQQLWKSFCYEFYRIHNKTLIRNEDTLANLEVLFHYFLKDPKFYKSNSLIKNLNKPDFKKGLLIIGGVGTGKTDYLKCFENIFQTIPTVKFKSYRAKNLVRKYEKCASPMDKEYYFKDIDRKQIFIDDIGSENNASNYGLFDVIGNILSDRYDNNQKTFLTTNFINSSQDVEETLSALGLRYGHRIYDRLFEMFNIIVFTGQSMRK